MINDEWPQITNACDSETIRKLDEALEHILNAERFVNAAAQVDDALKKMADSLQGFCVSAERIGDYMAQVMREVSKEQQRAVDWGKVKINFSDKARAQMKDEAKPQARFVSTEFLTAQAERMSSSAAQAEKFENDPRFAEWLRHAERINRRISEEILYTHFNTPDGHVEGWTNRADPEYTYVRYYSPYYGHRVEREPRFERDDTLYTHVYRTDSPFHGFYPDYSYTVRDVPDNRYEVTDANPRIVEGDVITTPDYSNLYETVETKDAKPNIIEGEYHHSWQEYTGTSIVKYKE